MIAAALSFVTVGAGGGLWLTLVLAGTGLFSFALHQIVQAAVLDEVGRGTEATAVGLIFGSERDTGRCVAVPGVPGDRELRRVRVGVLLCGDTDAGGGGADNGRANAEAGVRWRIR